MKYYRERIIQLCSREIRPKDVVLQTVEVNILIRLIYMLNLKTSIPAKLLMKWKIRNLLEHEIANKLI